jgi:cell division protein FtsA
VTAVENITNCLEKAGISVSGLVLQSLASAYSTLDSEEKKRGVVLMDIGSDVTDIIVYFNNAVYYTGTLNLAGNIVTSDISIMTGISTDYSEKIK